MSLNQKAKLDIIHDIPSEDILRDDLLVPIFYEMEEFVDIRVTHGNTELGKDVVLVSKDSFGDYVYTAIIIKNKKITNAVKPDKNREATSEIINQIVLTNNSGYDCKIQQKHVDFNKIIVITSQDVSHTAIAQINDCAKKHGNINIITKEDKDIVELVDKYLPYYFETTNGRLSHYLYALKKKCEKLNELVNISIYKGDVKDLLDVFVAPKLYRVEETNTPKGVQPKPIFGVLDRIIFEKRNILLVAGPGAGKSTTIRAQVQKLISTNSRGKVINVPIIVKAKNFLNYLRENMTGSINRFINDEYGISDFNFESYLKNTNYRVFFFIDGLDEIRLIEDRELIRNKIGNFAKENSEVKIVLASREIDDLEMFDTKTFNRWELLPFEYKQVERFISRWFYNRSEEILAVLKDHELLEKLPKTPLVLTLLAILYDDDRTVEVPANLSELYQMFIDLLVGRWSLDRRDNFEKPNIVEDVLMEIAKVLHESDRTSLSQDELENLIVTYSENLDFKLNYTEFFRNLVEQTSLLIINDKKEVEFRHLSFQEYLVAKRYSDEVDPIILDQLKIKFLDDWWSQIVYFYCGIKHRNDKLLIDLIEITKHTPLIPSIKSIWNYGYLVQASYLTPIKIRENCIAQELEIYSNKSIDYIDGVVENVEVPPAFAVLSLVHFFKLHYSTKFMIDCYKRIFEEAEKNVDDNFKDSLKILLIASILAHLGYHDYLLKIYDLIKKFPLLLIALDFEISLYTSSHAEKGKSISELKRVSKKIKNHIMVNSGLYRSYFELKKKAIEETAITTENNEN
ncbi:MAG: hypothetical protein CVU89_14505 [Firmicutes bacterium HGW-Firmicutes-14]|nr:MAG: hypothetical protein CVU89_14505 [Firmicutes bacterium HGW-Firmicutes-14]